MTLQQTALSTRDLDVQVWQPSYILVQMPLDMWQWTRWSATGGYVSHTGCFYASLTWSGWVSRSSRSMSEVSRSITAGPFVYLKTADKSSYRGRALVTQLKPYLLDIPPTRSSTFCDCFLLVAVLFILPLLYILCFFDLAVRLPPNHTNTYHLPKQTFSLSLGIQSLRNEEHFTQFLAYPQR